MTDNTEFSAGEDEVTALRSRAESAERRMAELEAGAGIRVVHLELKAEALRAGMIDLDGLKLIDPALLKPDGDGEFRGANAVVAQLRRDKPWLFGLTNSSSTAGAPSAAAPRRKLATEMSLDEWRTARAELLRRR